MEREFQQYPFIEYKQEFKIIHSEHDLFLSTKINRINIVKCADTGRHCFGKDPWCSPYWLQLIKPSFLKKKKKKKSLITKVLNRLSHIQTDS